MARVIDPKIEAFIADRISSGKDPRTAKNYGRDVARFGSFLQEDEGPPFTRLYDATEEDIRLFLSELRVNNAVNSLRRKKAAFEAFYAYLVRLGYREDNPAENIAFAKTPRRAKELFALTRDEVRRLLQAPLDAGIRTSRAMRGDFSARDRAILYFFYSGAKRHEITGVRVMDFDAKTRSLRVRGRQIALSKDAADAIAAYLVVRPVSKSKALFLTQAKEPISMRQAWFVVKRYLQACGLRADVDVETLRRSYAVHALEEGAYVLDVLAALGNVSMAALHEYAKLAREGFTRRRKIAEAPTTEIPFSRFLQAIHDIRVAATNLVLGSAEGKAGDIEATKRAIQTQIDRLRSEWPSLVDEEAFSRLQAHASSHKVGDFQELLAEDLSSLESRALAIFSENQQKKQEAGFIALLHPRIIQSSLRHFLDKDYRDSVLNAMLALTEMIREKSGMDGDGTALASRVFKPENPVLAISSMKTQSERDEQSGFHKMILGAYEGIRNPNSHDLFHGLGHHEAAQCLIFVSYLINGVEAATLMQPSEVTA